MNNTQLLFLFGIIVMLPGILQRLRGGVVRDIDRILATVPALLAFSWFGFIMKTGDYGILVWVMGIFVIIFLLTGGLSSKRILISTKGWEQLPEVLKSTLKAKGIGTKIVVAEDSKYRIKKRLDLQNCSAVIHFSSSRPSRGKVGDCMLIIKKSRGEKDVQDAVQDMIRITQTKFPYTGSFNEYFYYLLGVALMVGSVYLMLQ